jgi:hypothetical protein
MKDTRQIILQAKNTARIFKWIGIVFIIIGIYGTYDLVKNIVANKNDLVTSTIPVSVVQPTPDSNQRNDFIQIDSNFKKLRPVVKEGSKQFVDIGFHFDLKVDSGILILQSGNMPREISSKEFHPKEGFFGSVQFPFTISDGKLLVNASIRDFSNQPIAEIINNSVYAYPNAPSFLLVANDSILAITDEYQNFALNIFIKARKQIQCSFYLVDTTGKRIIAYNPGWHGEISLDAPNYAKREFFTSMRLTWAEYMKGYLIELKRRGTKNVDSAKKPF